MNGGFTYEPVLPLDAIILGFLPDEGAMFADIYPIGETVKAIVAKPLEGKVRTGIVSSRIRLLKKAGLVVSAKTIGGHNAGQSWQVTPAGKAMLKKWKGGNGGGSSED